MPTGYTSAVQDGKITTLHDFALECARAFGALVTMRDDPRDAAIPQSFKPETKYHDEAIDEARAALAELPGLSAEQCDRRAGAEFDAAMASHTEYETSRALSKQRYQDMLSKVEAWKCDPEVYSLREFMIEQLTRSIEFDCSENYRPEPPVRKTGERWREEALVQASRDLAYHTIEREKEIQRVKGRNKWLTALRKSLPEKPKMAA